MRARMQMIFQDPYSSLSPRMKVSGILIEPFRIHKIPVASPKQKVDELLAMVGLASEQADKYPHQLSGGQARRVGIARALALGPDLLVADEPTAGLDVSVAAGILNLLKDLGEKLNLTLLIITHNLNVISFIADRVAVMYLGKVVELGRRTTSSRARATLHRGADLGHRDARPDACASTASASSCPARSPAREPAAGLPVPSALPLCRGTLYPRNAAAENA